MEATQRAMSVDADSQPPFDVLSLLAPGCEVTNYHQECLLEKGISPSTSVQTLRRIRLHRMHIFIFGWVGVGISLFCWSRGIRGAPITLALMTIPVAALSALLSLKGMHLASMVIRNVFLVVIVSIGEFFYGPIGLWLFLPALAIYALGIFPKAAAHWMYGIVAYCMIASGYFVWRAVELGYENGLKLPVVDVQLITSFNLISAIVVMVFHSAVMGKTVNTTEEKLDRSLQEARELLLSILPESIVDRIVKEKQMIADRFHDASVLFADLVGFTELSNRHEPETVVQLLNDLFVEMDQLCEKHHLEKIKTIGDAYMVAGGISGRQDQHIEDMAKFSLDANRMLKEYNQRFLNEELELRLRIGIHRGPIVAGVIGVRKFAYDIWGDTVNTASRMESTGIPGEIQLTQAVAKDLERGFNIKQRGLIDVKGKGQMQTYFLMGEKQDNG